MELKYIVFNSNEDFVRWQRQWADSDTNDTLEITNYFPCVHGTHNDLISIFVVYKLHMITKDLGKWKAASGQED
jgi:hypothetical protein